MSVEALPAVVSQAQLQSYDHVILAFSGGKDSLACLLTLLEQGQDRQRIELWHHDVDGPDGRRLMDWPVTRDYCRKVAAAFDLPLFFSWRDGGFHREMMRSGVPTAPITFETPDGLHTVGGQGPPGTRRRFPQVTANLRQRWCSAYLKIDVFAAAIRNQRRFNGKRLLVVTGERAEESPARAGYQVFEPHRTHSKRRHVDTWRPVHHLAQSEIWSIIARWRLNPHPAYFLGWSRLSCKDCIFASANQCASSQAIDPSGFGRLVSLEVMFGVTVHRGESLDARARRGQPYAMEPSWINAAMADTFDAPIFIDQWVSPLGSASVEPGPS